MIKIGRKTKEWQKAKPKLVKIYIKKKIIRCEISGSKFALSFHHVKKRSSQEAKHTFGGTRLLNQEWHAFCEYNKEANNLLIKKPRGFDKGYFKRFKEMRNKKKKGKKPIWQTLHKCDNCKQPTSMLICEYCGEISVKK